MGKKVGFAKYFFSAFLGLTICAVPEVPDTPPLFTVIAQPLVLIRLFHYKSKSCLYFLLVNRSWSPKNKILDYKEDSLV